MAIIRVQNSFQGASGLPEDQYVNTWYVVGAPPLTLAMAAIAGLIHDFYFTPPPAETNAVSFFMGSLADETTARIKMYDMADAIPRTPLYDELSGAVAMGGGSANLPNELACCLSYAAAPVSGVPAGSTRGRLYIGPLNLSAQASSTTANSVVSGPLRDTLTSAAHKLAEDLLSDGYVWSIYSPTRNAAYPIVRTWVDDAWDIQRRRGTKPTNRVTNTIP